MAELTDVVVPTDVVVLPGRMFGPTAPLLMYSADVAQRRGMTVHRHQWSAEPPAPAEAGAWVAAEVAPLLDSITGSPLVIGKSLGSQAAALIADRGLPAVWLTPLLTFPPVVAALDRSPAPFLLIGGTADPVWDAEIGHRLTPHVLSVDGADHGMYVPGPLTGSIAVLGRVVVAVENFLDALATPSLH